MNHSNCLQILVEERLVCVVSVHTMRGSQMRGSSRVFRACIGAVVVVGATLAQAISAGSVAGASSIAISPFIGADGTQLTLNGGIYTFTGLNLQDAASIEASGDACPDQLGQDGLGTLDQQLTNIDAGTGGNAKVIRVWMFQHMEIVNGQIDWAFIDNVLATAQAHGFKVIPVLEDSLKYCEDSTRSKKDTWYETGYTQVDAGDIMSYQDWVQAVVTRYQSNPTIAMWMLMNEAQDHTSSSSCPSDAASILETFATSIGGLIHSIDHNHLVALGTRGVKSDCGPQAGTDYQTVNSSPGIDVCEFHRYDSAGAASDPALKSDISTCDGLNKPIIVGEVGIKLGTNVTQAVRATDFDRKMTNDFAGGISGDLAWDWVDPNVTYQGQGTYSISNNDPSLAVFGDHAPPVTTVLVPSSNSTVSGTSVVLDASANNESGISKVEFHLTGGSLSDTLIATATPTEFGYVAYWVSTTVPNGTYTLQSVAYDSVGLAGRSPAVPITVSN